MELDWRPSEGGESDKGNSVLMEHKAGGLEILEFGGVDGVFNNLMAN